MCFAEVCHHLRRTCADYHDFNWPKCPVQNFRTVCWSNNRVFNQVQQILPLNAVVKQSCSHPSSTNPRSDNLLYSNGCLFVFIWVPFVICNTQQQQEKISSVSVVIYCCFYSIMSAIKKKLIKTERDDLQNRILAVIDAVQSWTRLLLI